MTKFDKALDYALEQTANWEHRDHIKRIWLCGSCARGTADADSDIDLYIELDMELPAEDIRNIKMQCNPEDWRLPDVEVKIEKESNGADQEDLFHKNIKADGIILWERN